MFYRYDNALSNIPYLTINDKTVVIISLSLFLRTNKGLRMRNPVFNKTQNFTQTKTSSTNDLPTWKILLVDDEQEVHKVTEMALKNFKFDERSLEFLVAFNAEQARKIMENEPDIAIALIDVVMETDHAGLELVDYIRNSLNNHSVRLILRTGQPGQAPEETVIQHYDINDYKEKTELTVQKLMTLFYATLRSYRDIITIENQKQGMRHVIESSVEVLRSTTLNKFANSVLQQLLQLMKLSKSAIYCTTFHAENDERQSKAIAATGDYSQCITQESLIHFPTIVNNRLKHALKDKRSLQYPDAYVVYTKNDNGYENLLYVELERNIESFDHELLELYCTNVAIIYENLLLNEEIQESQSEIVYMLADAVEQRSKETGAHVKRVAYISEKLAKYAGLDDTEAEQIKNAAPLHDLGKIAIPDYILQKPGKYNNSERKVMNTHSEIGANILSKSRKKLLHAAADIAYTHHEHWDGNGYPNGTKGENIPISGRITALADVFDALSSKRCYKEAWATEGVKHYISEASGKQFDPNLVKILIDNFNEFCEIRTLYPD